MASVTTVPLLRVPATLSLAQLQASVTAAVTAYQKSCLSLQGSLIGGGGATTVARLSAPPPLTVEVEVAGGQRDALLRLAQAAFDAAAAAAMNARVDVIPLVPALEHVESASHPPADTADATPAFVRLHAAVMTPQRGFDPLYAYAAMGGTFDHLHAGHKMLLLTSLCYAGRRLRIGVAAQALLAKKKHASALEPFDARRAEVLRYCGAVRADVALEAEEITDTAGGTDRIAAVEALIVSPETAGAVDVVNGLRTANGLAPLHGVTIHYVGGSDEATRVSSTKLRAQALAGESHDETK